MIEASIRVRQNEFQLNAEIHGEGVICLVGRNGSGKSTLMRAMAGFLPFEGFIRARGVEVTGLPVERKGVVLITPSSFFPHLEVDSHIRWGAKLKGIKPKEDHVLKVKAALGIDFEGKVGSLSRGMRQRVALATVLLSSPRAILVDEAFLGLHEREAFVSIYGGLVKEAHADLVFSSQDDADGTLADHVLMMNNGSTTQVR